MLNRNRYALVAVIMALLPVGACSDDQPFSEQLPPGTSEFDAASDEPTTPPQDAARDGAESGSPDAGVDGSQDTDAEAQEGGDGSTEASTGDSGDAGEETDATEDDGSPDAPTEDAPTEDAPTEDAPTEDAPTEDAPEEAAADACVVTTFYWDKDGDGYGDSNESMESCAPPPGWVDKGGDCQDDDDRVHPDQTAYFGEGYVAPAKPGGISFDYNCNGAEQPKPSTPVAPACGGLLVCQGAGYEKATPARSGAGINSHCGSNAYSTCTSSGLGCKASTVTVAAPFACR